MSISASVTIDFLLTLPGFDFKNPRSLQAALYAVGFEVSEVNEEGKYVTAHIERHDGVKVRYPDRPYMYRETTVFSGRLRKDYKYASMYSGVDILDAKGLNPKGNKGVMVNSLPYDLPTVAKVNTRKYTKKKDRGSLVDLECMSDEDMRHTMSIFGEQE